MSYRFPAEDCGHAIVVRKTVEVSGCYVRALSNICECARRYLREHTGEFDGSERPDMDQLLSTVFEECR